MTLIVCIDLKGGILFNSRRQTLDYELINIIGKSFKNIYITPFSEKYFTNVKCTVSDTPFLDAGDDSTIFLESGLPSDFPNKIDKIILYRWNCVYPADTYLNFSPSEQGFKLCGKVTFSTEVHKEIVKEIYSK